MHLPQVVGAPIAAGFLVMDGVRGLRGWQWLYLATGALTVLFGFMLMFGLAKRPHTIWTLKPKERQWLVARQERDEAAMAEANAQGGSVLGEPLNPWLVGWLEVSVVNLKTLKGQHWLS